MRKIVLLLILCGVSVNLFSQTYKLEDVFFDRLSENHLSYWDVIEGKTPGDNNNIFSLWGFQRYDESWTLCYEVEYFKGNAEQMYSFLSGVVDFSSKYRKEDGILTYLSGVKVKIFKMGAFKYTFVYDKEQKVVCKYNSKQWGDILDDFTDFCKKNKIKYQ